jgi:hypothetical protein
MSNATDTIPEQTIRGGASEVYVSLARVKQIGVNLDSVTALLTVGESINSIRNGALISASEL